MNLLITSAQLGCQAAIAAALYLLRELSDPADRLSVTISDLQALLYLSEKASWEASGGPLCEERWSAGRYGPKPLLLGRLLSPPLHAFSGSSPNPFFEFERLGETTAVRPRASHDADYLSEVDLECLNAAVARFIADPGSVRQGARDAAWQAGRLRVGREMLLGEIIATLPNATLILEHLRGA